MPVNDLAVNVKGDLYFTDTADKKVWFLPKGGTPRVVDEGIEIPNGVLFSPDQTLLYVSDYVGAALVGVPDPARRLARPQAAVLLRPHAGCGDQERADGMAVDTDGRVYIATALGVQVFDQIGKCHAIIPAPQRASLSNVEFGGAEHGRDVRHERRQGLQAQDQGQGRAVVAAADQACAAALVRTIDRGSSEPGRRQLVLGCLHVPGEFVAQSATNN